MILHVAHTTHVLPVLSHYIKNKVFGNLGRESIGPLANGEMFSCDMRRECDFSAKIDAEVYRRQGKTIIGGTRRSIKLKFIYNTQEYCPLELRKNQTSKPKQSKDTAVYVANFRNSHGNQNLQGTSRELRILKFGTK
ncbi:unnamed protein product [Chilo suppressalis]|uniref:Uncharacterized protein n=1 Tax=Chilo suppressalis TaxID=168631 RepID=A0ABN8B3K3_CHISP|nr:unnamed protein product [Chilo suppressalis]